MENRKTDKIDTSNITHIHDRPLRFPVLVQALQYDNRKASQNIVPIKGFSIGYYSCQTNCFHRDIYYLKLMSSELQLLSRFTITIDHLIVELLQMKLSASQI